MTPRFPSFESKGAVFLRAFFVGSVFLIFCFSDLRGQPANPSSSPASPAAKTSSQEIEELRSENDRIRKERDNYKKDLDDGNNKVSSDLKVVAAQLSKEVKDDFYNSVTRLLWLLTLLVAIATAGGFWKLSDVITSRINTKVDEKEKDIQKLHDQVMDALLDFRMKAADALKELEERRQAVAVQTEAAITDIRTKTLAFSQTIDASGKTVTKVTTATVAPIDEAWLADLPAGICYIGGASSNQAGADTSAGDHYMGAFSLYFQEALRNPLADKDGDGKVSLGEAVIAASSKLKREGLGQKPVIAGEGSALALFSLHKPSAEERDKADRILAVLVGINRYIDDAVPLRGAVNDVEGFRTLLEDSSHVMANEVVPHFLTDARATLENIQAELRWLEETSGANDIALFYFSGHVLLASTNTKGAKSLVPHDFDIDADKLLHLPHLMNALGSVKARQCIVIVDG